MDKDFDAFSASCERLGHLIQVAETARLILGEQFINLLRLSGKKDSGKKIDIRAWTTTAWKKGKRKTQTS